MGTTRTTTASLLRRHARLWNTTLRNPFVAGVRDGSLPTEVFDRWVVQHRHFMEGVFPSICRTAAAAPERDRPALLQVLRNIFDYLGLLDGMLASRGLDPASPIHPVCRAYTDFTVSLAFEPYRVALVALWAQHRAYRDAWKWAHPGAPKFRGVVRTWYSPTYEPALAGVSRAADAALAEAPPREVRRAELVFLDVASYELAFWVTTMRKGG